MSGSRAPVEIKSEWLVSSEKLKQGLSELKKSYDEVAGNLSEKEMSDMRAQYAINLVLKLNEVYPDDGYFHFEESQGDITLKGEYLNQTLLRTAIDHVLFKPRGWVYSGINTVTGSISDLFKPSFFKEPTLPKAPSKCQTILISELDRLDQKIQNHMNAVCIDLNLIRNRI